MAQVDVRGLMRANRPLLALSMLSLFIVPAWGRSGVEVDTVLRDAQNGAELGRARTCHAFREVAHLSMLPLVPTHAIGPVEVDTIFGLARRGLALALATEADRARLFQRFYKAGAERRSGTGLGLAITRDIVRAHGGELGLHSSPGVGSTFIVKLPATAPEGTPQ